MNKTSNQSDGFASLTFKEAESQTTDGNDPRAMLHTASQLNVNYSWGGDCCDDGCQND